MVLFLRQIVNKEPGKAIAAVPGGSPTTTVAPAASQVEQLVGAHSTVPHPTPAESAEPAVQCPAARVAPGGDVEAAVRDVVQRASSAFLVDLDIAAQGCTPEAGGLGHMVGLAVDDDAAQSCAMCHAYTLSMMRSPNRPCGRKTRNISAST